MMARNKKPGRRRVVMGNDTAATMFSLSKSASLFDIGKLFSQLFSTPGAPSSFSWGGSRSPSPSYAGEHRAELRLRKHREQWANTPEGRRPRRAAQRAYDRVLRKKQPTPAELHRRIMKIRNSSAPPGEAT